MSANKMIVIGLTGGIGCGKSEAAKHLKALGAAHIDADGISRALTQEGGAALPAIRRAFGDGVFAPDGTLSRVDMARLVFSDEAAKQRLEDILHPMILAEVKRQLAAYEAQGFRAAILDVPLLFEVGWNRLCDECWTLHVPPAVQLERVMQRGLTREQAQDRIDRQFPAEERIRRADRAISTDRPIELTRCILTLVYFRSVYGVRLRPAIPPDLPDIRRVITEAQAFLKASGVDQWQDGFPSDDVLRTDIEMHPALVLEREGVTEGFVCIAFGEEPDYAAPIRGTFAFPGPYATIHRTAIGDRLRGLGCARTMFAVAEQLARRRQLCALRIDTHPDNLRMRRVIEREGFTASAAVVLGNGSERIVYEKKLCYDKE